MRSSGSRPQQTSDLWTEALSTVAPSRGIPVSMESSIRRPAAWESSPCCERSLSKQPRTTSGRPVASRSGSSFSAGIPLHPRRMSPFAEC